MTLIKSFENIVGKQGRAVNHAALTLSALYTHFTTLKKKALENIVGKGEIAQNEQFHFFPQCFLSNLFL